MYENHTELWELYRSKIAHEDLWAQQRVSWLLGFSGFWFAAFVGVLHISNLVSIAQTLFRGYLLLLMPVIGFLVTLFVLLGLIGAARVIHATMEEWEAVRMSEEERRRLPSLHAHGWPLRLRTLPSQGICVLLMVTWVVVFFLIPLYG